MAGFAPHGERNPNAPEFDVSEETARILFLTYGHDAVQMATLRYTELKDAGDNAGIASWKKVPENVRKLEAVNSDNSHTIN
jgi:hypothetical protein